MEHKPTLYIVCSDQHRNGKTLLARLLIEYLMLDGFDPAAIDTDAPSGALRNFFPGRTRLADFKQTIGRMKVFDSILASPGRDYVIDLPQRFTVPFFDAVQDLHFFAAAREAGFRVFVFFVVDNNILSARAAREVAEVRGIDLFVPVRNLAVGSAWPEGEGDFILPALPPPVIAHLMDRRFSIREFVMGNEQGMLIDYAMALKKFLYQVLQSLSDLEPAMSLKALKKR